MIDEPNLVEPDLTYLGMYDIYFVVEWELEYVP